MPLYDVEQQVYALMRSKGTLRVYPILFKTLGFIPGSVLCLYLEGHSSIDNKTNPQSEDGLWFHLPNHALVSMMNLSVEEIRSGKIMLRNLGIVSLRYPGTPKELVRINFMTLFRFLRKKIKILEEVSSDEITSE